MLFHNKDDMLKHFPRLRDDVDCEGNRWSLQHWQISNRLRPRVSEESLEVATSQKLQDYEPAVW